MADASIRFMVELDAAGQVKAIKALEGLGSEAAKQGKRFGDSVSGGFRKMADEWSRFVAGGMVLQRIFSAIGDTIRKAGDAAKARQTDWDKGNNTWRSDRMRQMTGGAALRMLGADNGTIHQVQSRLSHLKAGGQDVGDDFAGIAKTFAQRGLKGDELSTALKQAVEGLARRGHLAGFGESYSALAGGKGVAGGVDLTDLATGLVKRSFGMQDDQARALREGIAGGSVGVDAGGMVKALGEASADLAAAIKAVNGAGGLSLGAQGKSAALNGLDSRLGYAYTERSAQDGGLDWTDPGNNPSLGARPDGEAKTGDYAAAAWDSPVVQAAIAAALIKGMDVALSSAVFKSMLTRVFGTAGAAAATPVATAAGGAAAGSAATMAVLRTAAARASVVGTILSIGGDSHRPQPTHEQTAETARFAAKSEPFRTSLMRDSLRGDEGATRILEAMHAQLLEQTRLMRETAGVLVPAQAGE